MNNIISYLTDLTTGVWNNPTGRIHCRSTFCDCYELIQSIRLCWIYPYIEVVIVIRCTMNGWRGKVSMTMKREMLLRTLKWITSMTAKRFRYILTLLNHMSGNKISITPHFRLCLWTKVSVYCKTHSLRDINYGRGSYLEHTVV